ncbi:MAG: EcsC family protein [Janthinobacterium lividum]
MDSILSAQDLQALKQAKQRLEHAGLAVKLAGLLGTPFEKLLTYLPASANELVLGVSRTALEKCLSLALRTLDRQSLETPAPHNRWHKLAVATTGAAGGAFGLLALPIELPLTTTVMFRSICDIARSEGESLESLDTGLQCLLVFAMGGPARSASQPFNADADAGSVAMHGNGDLQDDAPFGYFVVRSAMAQAVSQASAELVARNAGHHGGAMLGRFVQAVASRFSAQVGEQIAARSLPVIGAVMGAAANTVFIGHFQDIAQGHFTVRRLERKYGEAVIREQYAALPTP